MSAKVLDALKAAHGGAIELLETQHGDAIAWVKRDPLLAVATWLKNDPAMAFGVCASTGGFYQNYSVMPGADQCIPVDVYIPGCPPRPEQVLDALILLQERIQRGEGHSQLVIQAEKGYDVPLAAIRPIAERSEQPTIVDKKPV